MNEVKSIIPGIDQIIIYLVAVVILLRPPARPDRPQGVMESLSHAHLMPTARNDLLLFARLRARRC